MNNSEKLFNFLIGNTHQCVSDVLNRFNKIEEYMHNGDAIDYKKLEKETGLGALDLLRLTKYYNVLKEHNQLGIIGKGDDFTHADDVVADALYCMNTFTFMVAFDGDYDKAIWDPTYDPATGFKQ